MSDIVKVREWEDTEGARLENEAHPEWGWAWPPPPKYIESRIEGQLRKEDA